jgi:hypothetical protein
MLEEATRDGPGRPRNLALLSAIGRAGS